MALGRTWGWENEIISDRYRVLEGQMWIDWLYTLALDFIIYVAASFVRKMVTDQNSESRYESFSKKHPSDVVMLVDVSPSIQ